MIEILSIKDDIVKVLFYLNLVLLVIGIFVSSKAYFITVIVINLILNGTFMVICKWSYVFQSGNGIFEGAFNKLGNKLDYFYNLGGNNGKIQG